MGQPPTGGGQKTFQKISSDNQGDPSVGDKNKGYGPQNDGTVKQGTTEVAQSGISGFFGNKESMPTYTAATYKDPNYLQNKDIIDAQITKANRHFTGMKDTEVGKAAQIDTQNQNRMRGEQLAYVGQLQQQAAGNGPSAAQAQLKMGADRAQAAAMARAAAGGTVGARRQASFEAAASQQDMAGQSAALRAQEQQQAMGMLGNTLQGVRQQDIGLATDQAGLNQQSQLAQAQITQDTSKTNLLAGQEFQKQKDDLVKQYVMAGMTLDEANKQAVIQQRQFNADIMARQEAAGRGVSATNTAQGAQTAGAAMAALGTIAAAAASDKRAKKNIGDGDKSIERFLDSVAAKDWDYKDPKKHGEGRRTGIMAQDAEKNSDMVFTHTDGVKMLDLGKATSTSLAALANINKRLRQLEG